MRRSVGRRLVAAVAACATLGGCYYPPGYAYGPGYGYPAPVVGSTPAVAQPQGGDSDGTAASPPGYIQQGDVAQGYASGYAPGYAPAAGYGGPGFVAPAYAPGYAYAPDYAGAAVAGLAFGALTGVAIASSCCYGGWGGYRGGYWRGGWGGGWRGGGWHGGGWHH